MSVGRGVSRFVRVYGNGYDLSGYTREIGPLAWEYDEVGLTTIGDAVKGYLPGVPKFGVGVLNGVFDNTATSGLHALASAGESQSIWTLMVAIGGTGEPIMGDPVYIGRFVQTGYSATQAGGAVYASVPFSYGGTFWANYEQPWGWLLRPMMATTTVNTSPGIDDWGAQTSYGGYMAYCVTAGNGTATIKVQDAATNSDASFADLSGATTGSVNWSTPSSGIVALGRTATVRRYLRWQIVFGSATSVTFTLAFVRGLR